MLRKGALLGWKQLLVISAASLFCFHSLPECGADYVETFPRPGASLPPPIAPGECPLVFLQADIQHADLSACSSGPTSCCGRLQAVLFQARVRYANETGRLLLPEASARACIEVTLASVPVIASQSFAFLLVKPGVSSPELRDKRVAAVDCVLDSLPKKVGSLRSLLPHVQLDQAYGVKLWK
jgi:hypothetical protein